MYYSELTVDLLITHSVQSTIYNYRSSLNLRILIFTTFLQNTLIVQTILYKQKDT